MEFKSVMYFDPNDSGAERANKFNNWREQNGMSTVGDKAVPTAEETRKYILNKLTKSEVLA